MGRDSHSEPTTSISIHCAASQQSRIVAQEKLPQTHLSPREVGPQDPLVKPRSLAVSHSSPDLLQSLLHAVSASKSPVSHSSQGCSHGRFAAFPPEYPKSASHQEGPRRPRFHLHRYVPKPVASPGRGLSVLPVARRHCLPFHPRAPLIPAGWCRFHRRNPSHAHLYRVLAVKLSRPTCRK